MGKINRPRYGSLQFWPRKRARRAVPRINWRNIKNNINGLAGFIAFKCGMGSAIVKDKTDKSMTQNKKIVLPVTLLEVPKMRILSVRAYKNGIVSQEIVVSNDKELKRVIKIPKQINSIDNLKDFDEIRVIVYTVTKNLFKKTPVLAEISVRDKDPINFVKNLIGKDISLKDINIGDLFDVHGLTKGKGFSGPIKRFGISLKSHKSEKGVRRPGSLGPWHPARVIFRVPMAGQLGMFNRVQYNIKMLANSNSNESLHQIKYGFKNYGLIKNDCIVLVGSVQGPVKRGLIITPASRPTKKQSKKNYEFLDLKL